MQNMPMFIDAVDTTRLASSPYFVFPPQVAVFADLPLLVSLEDLGHNLTVQVQQIDNIFKNQERVGGGGEGQELF